MTELLLKFDKFGMNFHPKLSSYLSRRRFMDDYGIDNQVTSNLIQLYGYEFPTPDQF